MGLSALVESVVSCGVAFVDGFGPTNDTMIGPVAGGGPSVVASVDLSSGQEYSYVFSSVRY